MNIITFKWNSGIRKFTLSELLALKFIVIAIYYHFAYVVCECVCACEFACVCLTLPWLYVTFVGNNHHNRKLKQFLPFVILNSAFAAVWKCV